MECFVPAWMVCLAFDYRVSYGDSCGWRLKYWGGKIVFRVGFWLEMKIIQSSIEKMRVGWAVKFEWRKMGRVKVVYKLNEDRVLRILQWNDVSWLNAIYAPSIP